MATPTAPLHPHIRLPNGRRTSNLEKRFDNTKFTYYNVEDPGGNSCGKVYSNDDFVSVKRVNIRKVSLTGLVPTGRRDEYYSEIVSRQIWVLSFIIFSPRL